MVTVVHHRSAARQRAELAGTYIYAGRPSKWGNPYRMVDPTALARREAIHRFYEYWYRDEQAQLRADALAEIPDGSVLGCFCAPKACHCDVIAEFLNLSTRGPA